MMPLFASTYAVPKSLISRGYRCFSSSPSFFSYTSGRARRRRELQQFRRQNKLSKTTAFYDNQDDAVDTRTVADILFPNPYKDEPNPYARTSRGFDSFASFHKTFSMAWVEYKSTWKGFFTSSGFLVEDKPEKTATKVDEVVKSDELEETEIEKTGKKIQKNVKRNVTFLREEADTLRKQVEDRTGIRSTEDLKEFARDMMRLASDCVAEFLAGYRKGRDDEVDKMLSEYFKDLQEKAEKPIERKRRAKRRVVTI
jgi:hypothetical protein